MSPLQSTMTLASALTSNVLSKRSASLSHSATVAIAAGICIASIVTFAGIVALGVHLMARRRAARAPSRIFIRDNERSMRGKPTYTIDGAYVDPMGPWPPAYSASIRAEAPAYYKNMVEKDRQALEELKRKKQGYALPSVSVADGDTVELARMPKPAYLSAGIRSPEEPLHRPHPQKKLQPNRMPHYKQVWDGSPLGLAV